MDELSKSIKFIPEQTPPNTKQTPPNTKKPPPIKPKPLITLSNQGNRTTNPYQTWGESNFGGGYRKLLKQQRKSHKYSQKKFQNKSQNNSKSKTNYRH